MNKLISVTLKNFWSFGNQPTTVTLNTSVITLILGDNRDIGETGDSRNGAGKSVLFNAIFWVLFDEGVFDIKQDENINLMNETEMWVQLELEINGHQFSITRGRKPNKIEILQDGEPFTLSNTNDINESIRSLLNTTPEIFKNTYLLDANQSQIGAFMGLKAAGQRDFMEKFLGLEKLSLRASALKIMRDDTNVLLRIKESELAATIADNIRVREYNHVLQKKANEHDDSAAKEITNLQENIASLSIIDTIGCLRQHAEKEKIENELASLQAMVVQNNTNAQKLHVLKEQHEILRLKVQQSQRHFDDWNIKHDREVDELSREEKTLSDVPYENILTQHAKLSKLDVAVRSHITLVSSLEKQYNSVSHDHDRASQEHEELVNGICPFCKQKFHDAGVLKTLTISITKFTEQMLEIQTRLSNELDKEDEDKKEYTQTQTLLSELPDKAECERQRTRLAVVHHQLSVPAVSPYAKQFADLSLEHKSLESLEKISADLKAVEAHVSDLEKSCDELQQQLSVFSGLPDKITLAKNETQLSMLKARLNTLLESSQKPNPYTNQIIENEKTIKPENDSAVKCLQKKAEHIQILIRLLTDSKSFVRKNIIETYLPFLNVTINNCLTAIDSAHAVKINSDLSVDLFYLDYGVSYNSLSKGEKLRLNYATNTAFRRMAATFGNDFNILLIDEYMDAGSDAGFFKKVFDELSREKKSIFVISHRDELRALADKEITVRKENGFSSIN